MCRGTQRPPAVSQERCHLHAAAVSPQRLHEHEGSLSHLAILTSHPGDFQGYCSFVLTTPSNILTATVFPAFVSPGIAVIFIDLQSATKPWVAGWKHWGVLDGVTHVQPQKFRVKRTFVEINEAGSKAAQGDQQQLILRRPWNNQSAGPNTTPTLPLTLRVHPSNS